MRLSPEPHRHVAAVTHGTTSLCRIGFALRVWPLLRLRTPRHLWFLFVFLGIGTLGRRVAPLNSVCISISVRCRLCVVVSLWLCLWCALAVEGRECSLARLLLRSGSAHWDLALAVEVRWCPLQSGVCCRGPRLPTAIWRLLLRSETAHCHLELSVGVWERPLSDEGLRHLSYRSI